MKKYFRIWWILAIEQSQVALQSRFGAVIFIFGKIIRFAFFIFFLVIIGSRTKLVANYNLWQMVFFYLTYNLIDTLGQGLFREVYMFRQYVVTGDFDYFLTKPISALFRGLLGASDILDIPMAFIIIASLIFVGMHLQNVTLGSVLIFSLLAINSFIIVLAFHIFVLCLGVVTTEVDNAIMLYRDIIQMGRVPVDIYQEPLRSLITFAVPVGIMMTVPAKAIMGILSWQVFVISFAISITFLYVGLRTWKKALASYSSASS